MTATRRRPALLALLAAAALVLGGCTAAPRATAAAPGPFDEVLGTVDLGALAGAPHPDLSRVQVLDVAALPDGRAYVLTWGEAVRLVEVLPGDDGPEAGEVADLPALHRGARLHRDADGGLLVAGSDGEGPVLLTVGDGEPAERRVAGTGAVLASATSPDGGTVYLSLAPVEEQGAVARLVAVDAATGEVTGEAPLGDGLDPRARAYELLPRPDGGVVAVISNPVTGGARDRVAEYDVDLEPVVAPFDVVAAIGATEYTEVSVGPAGDGDLVVLTEVRDGRQVSVFSGGDLVSTVDADFTGPVEAVVAGPSAGLVTLSWGRGGADPVVVTLDPATGELGEPLASCEGLGGYAALDLAADGSSGVAAGSCGDSDVVAVLVG